MGRLRGPRGPSPAMVVACVALAVALSGASYAAIVLPKNSVGTKQIRNNAVKSAKIAANQVNGVDVNEATLAQVPSALNATNAASAQNAGNADKLDGLDSSDFLPSGGKAADADQLDGADSELFQRRCSAGAVRAYAFVEVSDLMADANYHNLNDARFTCANSTNIVRAKRASTGRFTIDFGFNRFGPFDTPCPSIAVATLADELEPAAYVGKVTRGEESAPAPLIGTDCVFQVLIYDPPATRDADFVIAQLG